MHSLESVAISVIEQHLKTCGTGVALNLKDMPGQPSEYVCFKGRLDEADLARMFLWWENSNDTQDGSCGVTDALPSAKTSRVQSFIEGNGRFSGNVDLRTAKALEPVIVSNNAESGFLYLIDGSHRVLAQFFQGLPFQDIPVFMCVHPLMRQWAYVKALCDPKRNKANGERHPDFFA